MSKLKKSLLKKKNMLLATIMVFLLVCILIGFSCYRYYIQLQSTIKTESYSYMQEISNQVATNVNRIIKDRYSMLGTLKSVLSRSELDTYIQLKTIVNEQQDLWGFQKVLLIDEDGVAYDEDGKKIVLSNDPYLQDVIVNKVPALSTSQVLDGVDSVIFAVPLENIRINGREMVGLATGYDLSTFDQILDLTAFEGKGYAHIIREDGTVVIRSSSENALPSGYNVLNSLSEANFKDSADLEHIKQDIEAGEKGQAEFTLGDAQEYMTYTPMKKEQWSLLTFVPVEVVNAKSDMLLLITLLLCGFITVTFALLFAFLLYTFYRNKRKLEQIAYVDPITGGNTIERFYEVAEELLDASGKDVYALLYTNIEKFKVLNEQYGRDACDNILRTIEHAISKDLRHDECMGRLFADNFCVLIKYEKKEHLEARFERWYQNILDITAEKEDTWLPMLVEFGVYVIDTEAMPFPYMIDRAKLSLTEAFGEHLGKIRYVIYDESIRQLLFREKQLEDWMEDALEAGEFHVYLQPKYCTKTELVGGAEALVRWLSHVEGMIYPDEFIPLFEKNGFVIRLDFFVFEEVCKIIRDWLDKGVEPVKVSINCSRIHLKNIDFLDIYCEIADRYQVPRTFLEIELTENTVFGDADYLFEIIRKIREAGFGCSMDDFGSGYSSLNMIQDIPVDTLKLDRIFFRSTSDMQRSESVIGSILTMSKALSMETVAEGVEDRIQVDMLKRLECDYIQGYFFSKPLPISEFEQLVFGQRISNVQ